MVRFEILYNKYWQYLLYNSIVKSIMIHNKYETLSFNYTVFNEKNTAI